MCVAGHVARYAGTQFGQKVSHGPLWAITQTVRSYASRNHGVDMGKLVDDLLKSMAMPVHPACRGLVGRCQVCLKAQDAAQVKMQFLDKMMPRKDCCLEFSDKTQTSTAGISRQITSASYVLCKSHCTSDFANSKARKGGDH